MPDVLNDVAVSLIVVGELNEYRRVTWNVIPAVLEPLLYAEHISPDPANSFMQNTVS